MMDFQARHASKRETADSKHTPKAGTTRVKAGFLLLVFLAVVVGIGSSLFYFLLPNFFPLKQAQTILFVPTNLDATQSVAVARIYPDTETVSLLVIPGNEEVQVPDGYGQYRLQAVYSLLELEKKSPEMIRSAFSLITGLIIDEIIPVPDIPEQVTGKEIQSWVWQKIRYEAKDWETRRELLQLYSFIRQSSLNWQFFKSDARGKELFLAARQNTKGCSVAVVNTTDTNRLATNVGQVIENSGLVVVRTTSDQVDLPTSQIVYDQTNPVCVEYVHQVEKILPSTPTSEANQEVSQKYRAGVVVFLGHDLANK